MIDAGTIVDIVIDHTPDCGTSRRRGAFCTDNGGLGVDAGSRLADTR